MKIRIKGASIRIRLSRTEVNTITTAGYLEEETPFMDNRFCYALERVVEGNALTARFAGNTITMQVPASMITDWQTNDVISLQSTMQLSGDKTLSLLLEKDFQCIDQTTEDQSDNYINPNKNC